MTQDQYNQLLFLKVSGLANQLNQLVEEFKVELTADNFDSFQKWQKLNSLRVTLLDLQLEVGKDFHNQAKIASPKVKSKNSIFSTLTHKEYDELTRNKK